MRKITQVFLCYALFALLQPNLAHAKITQARRFSDIQSKIETLSEQDLVIFDIDEVIIQPTDQIFHPHHQKTLINYYNKLQNKLTDEKFKELLSIVNTEQPIRLVDKDIHNIFLTIRNRTIPTIALTHTGTGQFGQIKNVSDWRIGQLRAVGISFKDLTVYTDQIYHQLQGKYGVAEFKSGILFTGYIDKGKVLLEFLKANQFTPREIIFIDNKIFNLKDVEKALESSDIIFQGYEYVAVSQQPFREIDTKKTDLQFEKLEFEQKWVPDNQI